MSRVQIGTAGDTSLSLRRAWIEMSTCPEEYRLTGRSPYGERGLKYSASPVPVALLTESVD